MMLRQSPPPPQKALLCVNNIKEHLIPAERDTQKETKGERQRDTQLCTLTSPILPHRKGAALENGVKR